MTNRIDEKLFFYKFIDNFPFKYTKSSLTYSSMV